MSADLFAAFEDTSKPSQKGQSSKTPAQSDPFSFGFNNAATSSQIGHYNNPATQNWSSSPQPPSWSRQLQSAQTFSGAPSQSNRSNVQDDDDDGWGDFEVAPNVNQPPVTSAAATTSSGPVATGPQKPVLQRTRVVRASTLALISNDLLDIGNSSTPPAPVGKPAWQQAPPQHVKAPIANAAKAQEKPPKRDSNVLFDADDFDGEQEDEDDFGEFETVASPVQTAPNLLSSNPYTSPAPAQQRASELLSGLSLSESTTYPQAPKSPAFQDRNPFPGLAVSPPPKTEKQPATKNSATPVTAWPSLEAKDSAGSNDFGDDWGAFDEFPDEQTKPSTNKADSNWDWDSVEATQPKSKPKTTKSTKSKPAPAPARESAPKDSSWDWDPIDITSEKQVDKPKDDSPPTNIPPPSVLLSVFPQLFDQANTSLYKPVSGQSFSTKNRILSDPKTIEFLRGYVALATVAARVIAGRKLRWHRDKFLAQRMTISAAGSKGMKLAGVDKAQAAREDREAADVVAAWKEHIGRLRSAVATANSSIKSSAEQLRVPEISDAMPIQTEKMAPTAAKACVVCGLKRNERVSKVDYDVEDSFGEWWVEHWGHLVCKRFWLQHENALRQR